MIISKKVLEKEQQLIVKNANEIALAEFGKILNPIDLNSKYMQAISNIDINVDKDSGLIGIKKP